MHSGKMELPELLELRIKLQKQLQSGSLPSRMVEDELEEVEAQIKECREAARLSSEIR